MNIYRSIDVRFFFLAGMLIFLPGLEALKNITAFLFVLSWVMIAKKNNDWGGRWRSIDTIFFLWIITSIIISINAKLSHDLSGSGFKDVLRFVLLGWVISRTYFSKEKLNMLAFAVIIGTLFTLAYGYYVIEDDGFEELYSVGHINHTAIFLVIAYSLSLSLLLKNLYSISNIQRIFLLMSIIILFLTTIDTGSRAAFGLLIIVSLVSFLDFIIRSRKLSVTILSFGFLCFIGLLVVQNPPVALKRLSAETIFYDETRERIRSFSYYAFKKNPYLGIGFANYGQITTEDIRDKIIEDHGVLDTSKYLRGSHAHNVFYTYLVAGGILVFSIFLWFWFYVVWIIVKLRKSKESEWIVLSSIGVTLINLGIGWVNTTLHHEHAILSMFILGLLISEYRKNHLNNEKTFI